MSSKKRQVVFDPNKRPARWEDFTGLDVYKLLNSGENSQDIMRRYNISLLQLIRRLTYG